jgi:hypothetical protein
MKPWKVALKNGETRWQIFYRDPKGKGVGKHSANYPANTPLSTLSSWIFFKKRGR